MSAPLDKLKSVSETAEVHTEAVGKILVETTAAGNPLQDPTRRKLKNYN